MRKHIIGKGILLSFYRCESGWYLFLYFSQAHQILFSDFSPAPPNYEKSRKSCPKLPLYSMFGLDFNYSLHLIFSSFPESEVIQGLSHFCFFPPVMHPVPLLFLSSQQGWKDAEIKGGRNPRETFASSSSEKTLCM